ncbi:MAG TPA: TonB-dependent receptor [Methylomirabilota bacterium]|nr:TonB-dependent receptor [Methylomirabilota bacterium]
MKQRCIFRALVWTWFVVAVSLAAAEPEQTAGTNAFPLTRLSLRELAGVEVTSASRTEESLLNAAAAISVISNEDIRRSGALNIADALRMAPGLNVAQINANKWAVSARGFNSRFANKLLVLMDGRRVYTPLSSGVHWDIQDTLLADLDQIEVIRGPGGALWGANAVNGVINITTKPAWETQGFLLTATAGSELNQGGAFRYGGALATNLHYRVYAKAFNHEDFLELDGGEAADEWWQQREGFRVDWRPTPQDLVTFQGDAYYGRSGDRLTLAQPTPPFQQSVFERARAAGGDALARWNHTFSEISELTLQAYYDRTERSNVYLDASVDTYDVDLQHRIETGDRNEIIWGAAYSLVSDEVRGGYSALYDPISAHDQLASAFLQDRYELIENRLWATAGAKVEHNDYSGWEFQPSARLTFKPQERQTLWAAVSRAVRTPARFERDSLVHTAIPPGPGGSNMVSRTIGGSGFDSEKLVAYEVGHRIEPRDDIFLDLALYYNDYDELRSSDREARIPGAPGSPTIIPATWRNNTEAEAYGFEFAPSWQVREYWRLRAGYSLLKVNVHSFTAVPDPSSIGIEGDSPQQQFHLRSMLDLPHHLQLDSAVYYVDELPNQRLLGSSTVQDYTRLDVRLGWVPRPELEFSLVFQNLLDPQHPEFGSTTPLVTPTEIERSVYAKVTWRF